MPPPPQLKIPFDGYVTYTGWGRFGGGNFVFPTTTDGGPTARYLAGNFEAIVPESSSILMLGTGLLGLGGFARRRLNC